ncbi:MAG: hypothetical protein JNK44_09165 [Cyclobacteriaceae bacterium]|nr:hypothetical protein [Cyclobacteriaceae bacterium]
MKKLPLWWLVMMLLISVQAFSQTTPDSLEIKLRTSTGIEKARHLNEAVYRYAKSDYQKAENYVRDAFALARQHPQEAPYRTYALLNKGIVLNFSGRVDSAVYYLVEAKREVSEADFSLRIKINAALGKSYITVGQPQQGLDCLYETLRLLQRQPDKTDEMKVHSNIMWAYLELKRYRDCIRHGQRALAQLEPQQEWIMPYITNNMAASYGALNNLDSARHYIEQGLPLAKKYIDYGLVANCYFILGNLYANAGLYALALEQFTLAQPYREKTGNVFYQVADLYVMADLYYKLKNYQQGIQTGLAGLQLAEQNNLTLKLEGVYQALAKNYEALEDFRNASKYFQLLANIKDTLYQRATADALADMQLRYETEKKELQLAEQQRQLKQSRQLVIFLSVIVVLSILLILVWRKQVTMKQRETLLKREKDFQAQLTRAVLSSQEEERARTARDLHDGFGQLIASAKLCINQAKENWRTHATDLLDQMHQEIRNISFALLPHTLVSEGLVPALEELAERISKIGTLQVHVHAAETHRLNSILEVSIYRACQEWITNISKYATASQVHLNIIHDAPTLSVTIEDDGLGFNPQMLNQGNGNGWKNIQSRIQLHEGTVWVDSEPGKRGSTLLMEVPLDVQRKVA